MEAISLPVGGFVKLSSSSKRRRKAREISSLCIPFSVKKTSFSSLLTKPSNSSLLLLPRSVPCFAHAHETHNHQDHNHQHDHDHEHDHGYRHHQHQHHGHHHHHHGEKGTELNKYQEGVLRFAKAFGWADLANFLREHLQLCCYSTVLLVSAALCPYLLPKNAVKPLQNAFIAVAFPLVGVWYTLSMYLF